MQWTEQITEVAVVKEMGAPVDAWRSIVTVTTTNFAGDAERSDVYYVFHSERDVLGRPITLGGETPAIRDSISSAYVQDLRFVPPSVDRAADQALAYPPHRLIDGDVQSFALFQPQYADTRIVLTFDSALLELYVLPEIEIGEDFIAWGRPSYLDALCQLVGTMLVNVDEYFDRDPVISFSIGTTVAIAAPSWYLTQEWGHLAAMYGEDREFAWYLEYDFSAPDASTSMKRGARPWDELR